MGYTTLVKVNELAAPNGMTLTNIVLCEGGQAQREIFCMIQFTSCLETRQD